MQRILKFRVWDIINKRFLWYNKEDYCFYRLGLPYNLSAILQNPERFNIQQFTGLQDKNGKDIYEGDIMKIRRAVSINGVPQYYFGEIYYSDYSFKIRVGKDYDYSSLLLVSDSYDDRVMGNIFETPKLLK